MGFFISHEKIFLAEPDGRITSLLDLDEVDYPCTFINNEAESYEDLKQILINENTSRWFDYSRVMGRKPILELATTATRSMYTILFYDYAIYEECEDGTIIIANNLNKRTRDILNSSDSIFIKYQRLLTLLPIKIASKAVYRLGRDTSLDRSGNGLIYRFGDAYFLVGSPLADFFDKDLIQQLLNKNKLKCYDHSVFKSSVASAYIQFSFIDFIRELNTSAFLILREKISLDGDKIIYGENELFIKQSMMDNKWYISGPFELVLDMFGVKTRDELNEYISGQLGRKRRNGVFPTCDSREEVLKLIESIQNEQIQILYL